MRLIVGAMIVGLGFVAGCTPHEAPTASDPAAGTNPEADTDTILESGTDAKNAAPETVEKLVSGKHGALTDHDLGPEGVTYEVDSDGDTKPDTIFTDLGNDGSIDAATPAE